MIGQVVLSRPQGEKERMNQPNYIFNKSEDQPERDRLILIEQYHDPRTRERLQQVGICARGTCLEVGPGAGSIMRWMARIVGPQGHVMAIELNPRFLSRNSPSHLTLIQGDINKVPLPSKTFQVHTPSHQRALKKIIEALRPGGWLVLEEPDFSVARVVTGPKGLGRSVQRVNEAIQHMFSNAGLDPAFGVKLPGLLQDMGLVNLTLDNDTPLVQGGSPMATIMKLSAHQLAERYLATGRVTKTDLTRYVRFAKDPDSWAVYHATVAVMTQKKPRGGSTKTKGLAKQ